MVNNTKISELHNLLQDILDNVNGVQEYLSKTGRSNLELITNNEEKYTSKTTVLPINYSLLSDKLQESLENSTPSMENTEEGVGQYCIENIQEQFEVNTTEHNFLKELIEEGIDYIEC